MKKFLILALVLGAGWFLLTEEAFAHGGSFRGPNGGVPPGLREPSDPEPPPPPPSDPGDPGGPTTPGQPNPGPTTPGGDSGIDTPSDTPPPQPINPTQGPGKRSTTKALTFDSWRFWWAYNNDDILNLKSHIYAERVSSSSALHFASGRDEENRRSAQRPTARAVKKTIIPALMASVNRPGDHDDIHGGALVALGKIGSANFIDLFKAVIEDKYRNPRGKLIKYGPQARESAVLALGLLPNMDQAAKDAIRKVLLETIADDSLRTRERTWAAVSIGLQRDRNAIQPLVEALGKKYPDDNIPAGLLLGLGLIGDLPENIVQELQNGFEKGTMFGRQLESDRVRSFIAIALAKNGDPRALDTILKVLNSRKMGRIVKRSAAIAAGVLGSRAKPEMKAKAVQTLLKFIRKSGGDPSGENFAIIALSQIGTPKALSALLDIAESGKYGQRPFAALGLATHVFYKDRAAEEGRGEGMDKEVRAKIVAKLRKLSQKYKDADTKAAMLLSRGLVKDKTAIEECVSIAAKRSNDPVLRGFACVALGLIGNASEQVKDALKMALRDRKSVDLRRDAATGLALLRDADVVKILLEELKKAKSFAVQGQLITGIGTIGDYTAILPLVKILDNTSQPAQTRAMAAVGLGMIGDLRPIPLLSRVSKNYNYRASVPDLDELLFVL